MPNGYEGYREVPWWERLLQKPVLTPWQTAKGEGFIAPWTPAVQQPGWSGLYEQYRPEKITEGGVQLTSSAAETLSGIGYDIPPEVTVAKPTVQELVKQKEDADYASYRAMGGRLSRADWIKAGKPSALDELRVAEPQTEAQATELLNRLYGGKGGGFMVERDPVTGGWNIVQDPHFVKPPTRYPREPGQEQTWTDNNGIIWGWDEDANNYIKIGYDETKDLSRQPKPPEPMSPYEEEYLGFQRQQLEQTLAWQMAQEQGRLEAERQRQLASLRANPASWLEYASLAGQTPAIQPWMMPLMPQQYAGMTAGQALPGWQPTGESLAGLPQLTTPSRQYQARVGPTAMAQYGGYEQARTGIPPEEQEFRLWSQAPPGGRFGGLSWLR